MQDFVLRIRDDRSSDSTFAIASEYARKYPGKVFAEQNLENSGGAKRNFMKMMIDYKDEYVMLCDQDDVWLPDKIEKSLEKMKEMERKYGKQTPILVHTDLKVVDENLDIISQSYKKMANSSYKKNALNNVVTMNIVTGSTALYNRALADEIMVEPDFYVIHDWWLALTAAALGKMGAIYEPTALYRQHGDNDIGAKKVLSPGYIVYVLTHLDKMSEKVNDSYKQAGSFLSYYKNRLTGDEKKLLEAYSKIPEMSRFGRLRTVMKHKTFMHSFSRKAARMILLLKERRVVK